MTYTRDTLALAARCLDLEPGYLQDALVLHDNTVRERDRYRAALEKCAEAVGWHEPDDADERLAFSKRVAERVQTMARALAQTNTEIDTLTKGNNGAPPLDRLRWFTERLERNAKDNAEQYTVEVKLKRAAQQELANALGLVKTHRAERNAARGWVEDLARAIARANTAPSTHQLGVKAITWLRCQSGYGAPSGAAEAAPAAQQELLNQCLVDAHNAYARGDGRGCITSTLAAVEVLARLVSK